MKPQGSAAVVRSASLGSLQVEQLTCSIGAELRNVNLGAAVADDDLFREIRSLLLQHKVLFFRDQDITRAEHVALPADLVNSRTIRLRAAIPSIRVWCASTNHRCARTTATRMPGTRMRPGVRSRRSVRAALCRMPTGRRRYDVGQHGARLRELPDHIKEQIANLRARHSIEATFGAAMPIEKRLALKAQFPGRRASGRANAPGHRRENPVRESLYHALHQFPHRGTCATAGLCAGWRGVAAYLISQAHIPEYQVRWRWKPNSIAFWDNRSTQHYAVMDYPPCHRKMERAGIKGDARSEA